MSRFVWQSLTSGQEFDLTNWVDEVAFLRGFSGLIGAPPVRKTYDYVPGLPGAVVRQVIHDVKTVRLPLIGLVDGHEAVMELVRKMVLVMDPVRNDEAVLRYIRNDGSPSDLYVMAVSGLEVDDGGSDGPNAQKFALGLDAVDPYWYGPQLSKRFTAGEGGSTPWFPFPPLVLASGSVLGNATLNIESDVETWPVWVASGPSSGGLHIERDKIGKEKANPVLELNGAAELVNETVTVDSRPRGDTAKTIIGPDLSDGDGTNWFPKTVAGKRALWALKPGPNKLNLILPGATSGVSTIEVFWRNARLTP